MYRSTILIAALVAGAPGLAAQPGEEARSEVVSYSDLDIESEAGKATLDHRIRAAANRVCTDPNRNWQEDLREQKCRTLAIANANRQVRSVTVELAVVVTPRKP